MGLIEAAYRFCPLCGSALHLRRVETHELPACPACEFVAFRDPKVVVAMIAHDDAGRVLALRRGIAPAKGEWALPGGYVDFDEHPARSAERECWEETGCRVVAERLEGVHHVGLAHAGLIVLAYSGPVLAGVPTTGPEALELAFFAPPALPDLAFTSHREVVAAWLAARTGASSPAAPRG